MSNWIIFTVGILAQVFFGARLLSQWLLSEKAREVRTPTMFWKFSLFGSLLMFAYGFLRHDLAIMLGQILIYLIYIRNMQLQDEWKRIKTFIRFIITAFPVIFLLPFISYGEVNWDYFVSSSHISTLLLVLGVLGQLIFNGRFIYQWIYSEKNGESSLPGGFWRLSLLGAFLILTYGIMRSDPVLIASHFFGIIIYLRNLRLLKVSRLQEISS